MSTSIQPIPVGPRSAPQVVRPARALPAVIDLREPAVRRRQAPPGLRLPRGRGGRRDIDRLGLLIDEYV